jgi:nucleoside-diphosphate-sugar epimerase
MIQRLVFNTTITNYYFRDFLNKIHQLMQMDNKKTYLVTGATGFIGSKTIDLLLKKEDNQIIATDLAKNMPHKKNYQEALEQKKLQYQQADITQKGSLCPYLDQVTDLIHIAGLFNHRASEKDLMKVNATGTKYLLEAARDHDVERVIHFGSSSIYGHYNKPLMGSNSKPTDIGTQIYAFDERTIPNPCDNYAKSKHEGRQIAASFNTNNAMSVLIIDPTGVFGPGNIYGNVEVIKGAINGSFLLPHGGEKKSSNIHVNDVAGFARYLLKESIRISGDNAQNLSYLVATPDARTASDLMQIVWDEIPKNERKNLTRKITSKISLGNWALSLCTLIDKFVKLPIPPTMMAYGFSEQSANPAKMLTTGYQLKFPTVPDIIKDTMDWHKREGLLKEK